MHIAIALNILVLGFVILRGKNIFIKSYLVVNYLLIINPALMGLLFNIYHPLYNGDEEMYISALYFNLFFTTFLLCISFLFSSIGVGKYSLKFLRRLYDVKLSIRPVPILLMWVISAIGKVYLMNQNAFSMLGEVQGSSFLQAAKSISGFDFISCLFVSVAWKKNQLRNTILLVVIFGLSISLALITGSRSQVAFLIIILLYAIWPQRTSLQVLYTMTGSILGPVIFILFPFLGTYRISGESFLSFARSYNFEWESALDVAKNVLITRLNYLEFLGRVMDYVALRGPNGGSIYWMNLLGVIPRILWSNKPIISNDSHELGHRLGVLTTDDTATSIGLQPVGEAFYELGYWGAIIACIPAFIFVVFNSAFYNKNVSLLSRVLLLHFLIYMMQRDGYFAVLPGLFWQMISAWIYLRIYKIMSRI